MPLVTPAEIRVFVATNRSDSDLETIIASEEAEIVRLFGPHYDGSAITETFTPESEDALYLSRSVESVSSVTEYGSLSPTALATAIPVDAYLVDSGAGIIRRVGQYWNDRVVVTYIPEDDTERRKRAIIELVKISVSYRSGFKSENMKADNLSYSYHAPDGGWAEARRQVLRSLGFVRV